MQTSSSEPTSIAPAEQAPLLGAQKLANSLHSQSYEALPSPRTSIQAHGHESKVKPTPLGSSLARTFRFGLRPSAVRTRLVTILLCFAILVLNFEGHHCLVRHGQAAVLERRRLRLLQRGARRWFSGRFDF